MPLYELPQLLISDNGKKINISSDWEHLRRPEIHSYFTNQVYGLVPTKLNYHKAEVLDFDNAALGGKAIRKQVKLNYKKPNKSL